MAYETNPFLAAQGAGIQQQANQNLFQNIMPGINSGAGMAGQYGGSRHGIAQGIAAGQTGTGIANALAGLYGGAYEGDQNRNVQRYGIDSTANTARYNTDKNYDLGLLNDSTNQRGQTLGHEVGMANANNSRYGMDLNFASNRYNTDVNAGTTARGQDLNYGLGTMQNQTAQRGQDVNWGLGNLQNATQARGQDLTYGLGMNQNDTQRLLGLGQIDSTRRAQDMGFYDSQRGQDRQDVALGAQLYGAGMQGPWGTLQSANGLATPYAAQNGTQTQTTNSGGGWQGLLGGVLGGAQFAKNQGWWGTPTTGTV
jgi:hypothetical protein